MLNEGKDWKENIKYWLKSVKNGKQNDFEIIVLHYFKIMWIIFDVEC